jgi:lysophospholipase L1-like esterase
VVPLHLCMGIFDAEEKARAEGGANSAAPEKVRAENPASSRAWLKTAQMLIVLAAALLGWQEWGNHEQGWGANFGSGMAPHVIGESFSIKVPHAPEEIAKRGGPARPVAVGGVVPVMPKLLIDESGEMDGFFAALWKIEQQPKSGVVTVLHYGDSPTTADLITGDVRASLQERFGDAGRGYTLIAKPWPWYGHRGVEVSGHGWRIKTGVGLMREGIYGLGGASFEGEPGAGSSFRLTESQQQSVDVEYLAKPGGGEFAVSADGVELTRETTAADELEASSVHVELPAGTKSVEVHPTVGTVELFGAEFHRGPGVLYDSLGLNGATTSVLARTQPPGLWKEELTRARPQLIIVNYGSNESSFGNFVRKQYADELRLAIQRIRVAAPGVSILVMSPMDRGERRGLDEIRTMATIPEIVEIQRKVAAETHCAFFDTYNAMGGDGTIARWYEATPRLVTADLLHPTPQGAGVVAGFFVDQLSLGYDRWKMRRGIAFSAAAVVAGKSGKGATSRVKRGGAAKKVMKKVATKDVKSTGSAHGRGK